MFCENCYAGHDGSYGSGRFCSNKCARSFSTKEKRAEINEKVSSKLTGKSTNGRCGWEYISIERKIKGRINSAKHNTERAHYDLYVLSWDDFIQKSGKQKIRKRVLIEQDGKCICGLSEWNGKKLSLQLHHKDGDHDNRSRDNLECLCPNCHSITKNFGFKGRTHIPWNKGKSKVS